MFAFGEPKKLKYSLIHEYGFDWWTCYAIWIGFALFFILIASAAGYFNQYAEGSGIPEIKSILAGVYIFKYLSFRTLIWKIIGMIGSLSSGLTIGKEGPFVHIAAWITNKLSKFSVFKDIANNHLLK